MKNKFLIITILAFLLVLPLAIQFAHAEIIIKSIGTNPSAVKPGENIDLTISIQNTGDEKVESISIALDLTDIPFVPVDSTSEKIIERIYTDEYSTINFKLKALPEAEAKTYKLPIIITYNQTKRESTTSLSVYGNAKLDIKLNEQKVFVVNQRGDVALMFINTGTATIDLLTVSMLAGDGYDPITTTSTYIGKLEPGDYDTVTFQVYTTSTNPSLKIKAEYQDQNKKIYSEIYSTPIKIYTLEEAKKLGLIKPNNFFYALILVLIILIILIIRKIIRARKRYTRLMAREREERTKEERLREEKLKQLGKKDEEDRLEI